MGIVDRKITSQITTILELPDEPNASLGLTPEQLKAKFDLSPEALRIALNGVITDLIASTGATNIGAATGTVQEVLTSLRSLTTDASVAIDDIVSDIAAEVDARIAADTALSMASITGDNVLQNAISVEASTRSTEDETLRGRIVAVEDDLDARLGTVQEDIADVYTAIDSAVLGELADGSYQTTTTTDASFTLGEGSTSEVKGFPWVEVRGKTDVDTGYTTYTHVVNPKITITSATANPTMTSSITFKATLRGGYAYTGDHADDNIFKNANGGYTIERRQKQRVITEGELTFSGGYDTNLVTMSLSDMMPIATVQELPNFRVLSPDWTPVSAYVSDTQLEVGDVKCTGTYIKFAVDSSLTSAAAKALITGLTIRYRLATPTYESVDYVGELEAYPGATVAYTSDTILGTLVIKTPIGVAATVESNTREIEEIGYKTKIKYKAGAFVLSDLSYGQTGIDTVNNRVYRKFSDTQLIYTSGTLV